MEGGIGEREITRCTILTFERGESSSQLLWIVAALALADELLPSLQDVPSREEGEEGRGVGDVKRGAFLQSHTRDHLQGVVRPGLIREHICKRTMRLANRKTRRQFGEQLWLRRAALGKRPEREAAQPAAKTCRR